MKRYIDPYRRRIPAHRIGYLRLESSVVVIVKYSRFLGDFSDARQRAKVGSRDCAAGRKIARAVLVIATLRGNGVDRAGLNRLSGWQGATLHWDAEICRNHPPNADFNSSSLSRHITAKMAM
ncbi:MAG: hypothetical protein WB760_15620 [Xanthobacteraceae bacterium]